MSSSIKVTRSSDKKIPRPSTARSLSTKNSTTPAQKSYIPKIRSFSQPPSKSSHFIRDSPNESPRSPTRQMKGCRDVRSLSKKIVDESKKVDALLDENIILVTDVLEDFENMNKTTMDGSIKSDDFKDALDTGFKIKHQTPDANKISTVSLDEKIMTRSFSAIPIPTSLQKSLSNSARISLISTINSSKAASAVRRNPVTSSGVSPPPPTRRVLEMQFLTKKKRLDLLKKEIIDKQKPVLELYQCLVEIKKKLDHGSSGKQFDLDPLNISSIEDKPTECAAGEQIQTQPPPESEYLNYVKSQINEMLGGIVNICGQLRERRTDALKLIEKYDIQGIDKNTFIKEFEHLKIDESNVAQFMDKLFDGKDKLLEDVVEKLSTPESLERIHQMKEIQTKIKKQEAHIKDITQQLQKAKHDLNDRDNNVSQHELKEKITQLEKQCEAEHKKYSSEAERYRITELNLKAIKSKVKDFDTTKLQQENRVTQLSSDVRSLQMKVKLQHREWDKEVNDLKKARQLDKQVIERMSTDKATFESRIQIAMENEQKLEREKEQVEYDLLQKVGTLKDDYAVAQNEIVELKKELEDVHIRIGQMQVQNEQAAELLNNQNPNNIKSDNDIIVELQCENSSHRATIRALQEKIETNANEKLRFIETVDKMSSNDDNWKETVMKSIIKKDEEIAALDIRIKKFEDLINKQKIQIEDLNMEKTGLLLQIEQLNEISDGSDIKNTLVDSRCKIQEAYNKTLENSRKTLKFEEELGNKNKVLTSLENKIKMRDGLLAMLKAKRDELMMENSSLLKYAEQVRTAVIDSRQALDGNEEQMHDLRTNLDEKSKALYRADLQIRDLKEKLTITNEKRYKLQDTIGKMEKELQTTKALLQENGNSNINWVERKSLTV